MTAISHIRGHQIEYHNEWIYSDTKESASIERPCIRCGEYPDEEGHDACLGHIIGVKNACCGHGVKRKYVY